MTAAPDPAAVTIAARACCLDRWICESQPGGKARGEMAMPCGFELAGTNV